jgi:DNA-directed RNA polymerase subunit beta'
MNHQMDKKALTNLVAECYQRLGKEGTVALLENLKETGFYYATKSGLSIGIDDMHIPEMKEPLVEQARQEVVEASFRMRKPTANREDLPQPPVLRRTESLTRCVCA